MGKSATRNYLLPISSNLEQTGDEPIDQLTLEPSADGGLPANGLTERWLESPPGLLTKQSDPFKLKPTELTTSDLMSNNSQAGQDQPAAFQQSAHIMRNQPPWRYWNFTLQKNTTNPGVFNVWMVSNLSAFDGRLVQHFWEKYSVKALYLKSVRHEHL